MSIKIASYELYQILSKQIGKISKYTILRFF